MKLDQLSTDLNQIQFEGQCGQCDSLVLTMEFSSKIWLSTINTAGIPRKIMGPINCYGIALVLGLHAPSRQVKRARNHGQRPCGSWHVHIVCYAVVSCAHGMSLGVILSPPFHLAVSMSSYLHSPQNLVTFHTISLHFLKKVI